jgi:DNA-binding CsgD family transcriptional regulator
VESLDKGIVENLDAGLECFGLTPREIQILRQLALGKGDKQISIDLLISVKTVNHHVSNIILKLDAKNRTHAVAKALLTRQIVMRVTDAPARIPNRRLGDRDKAVHIRFVANTTSVRRQIPGHIDEALPRYSSEGPIKAESST